MSIASPADLRARPAALEAYAADNLQFIRDTMERAAAFTAVPGEGGVVIGLSALAAGYIAHGYPVQAQFWIWLIEGFVAAAIGIGALYAKSRRIDYPLTSRAAKRALLSFAAPLAAGALMTFALFQANVITLFAGFWLSLYGVAVVTAGAFSVRVVPLMGLCFLALGACALLTPATVGNAWMTAGFGGLHVIFGFVIARKHGG